MSKAAQVRDALLGKGLYYSVEELAFLTDDYLTKVQKEAVEITHEKVLGQLQPMGHVWNGNHWHDGTENGVRYWYWEDKIGSQCGRERTWKYRVNTGDSVVRKGNCPQGYAWFEMILNYP